MLSPHYERSALPCYAAYVSLPLLANYNELTHEEQGFLVDIHNFSGTLGELAHALRSQQLLPNEVDVLGLVRTYLRYYERVAVDNLELATETLPQLARVVELKARLLLPRPPKENEDEEDEVLEKTLAAITLLEDLEEAIYFLKRRREERRIILTARTPRPDYPRPARPLKIGAARLAETAARYRLSNYFELAVERLTMAAAMKHLQTALARLRRGRLSDLLPSRSWESLVMSFTGMLELVKDGTVHASQTEPYAPIELELIEAQHEDIREVA